MLDLGKHHSLAFEEHDLERLEFAKKINDQLLNWYFKIQEIVSQEFSARNNRRMIKLRNKINDLIDDTANKIKKHNASLESKLDSKVANLRIDFLLKKKEKSWLTEREEKELRILKTTPSPVYARIRSNELIENVSQDTKEDLKKLFDKDEK